MGTLYEVEGTTGIISSIRNYGSTQWGKTLGSTAITTGNNYNMFVDIDPVEDKDSAGTTTYDELDISYGIDIRLTGTSGTANIVVDGTTYAITFNTSLTITAQQWISTNQAALLANDIRVLDNLSGRIRFCATEAKCNSITITNTSGDLNGTVINGFTGLGVSAPDHILQPYTSMPYNGQRLQYNIRVNLNIDTGNLQAGRLSLHRFENDTLIGSTIPILRNPDDTGQQVVFLTYTASASDPFVTGGFYFLFENDSGTTLTLNGKIGFLIQVYYQYPTHF